jgi:hypothetical protein
VTGENTLGVAPDQVLALLERDGVVKLDGFLSPDTLAGVRKELDAANSAKPAVSGPPSQRGQSIYPTSLLVRGRLGEIKEISRVLSSPVLQAIRQRVIGRSGYVTDVVGIDSLPIHKAVTQWHVDGTLSCINKPGDARIKLFFYLNDVTSRNGAFSYVAGSHKILDSLHRGMHDGVIPPLAIRDLSTLRDYCAINAPPLSADEQSLIEQIFASLDSDTAPCGPYSLEGPAGTLIIFDERGMHRGGDISEGQRSILRISLKQETFRSPSEFLRTVVRKLARIVLPRHYASLM